MQILAISNHKGGVGKTATAQAIAAVLAQRGYRVLLVDTDPQASLTNACGITDAAGRSLAEVLGGATAGSLQLADVILTLTPNLHLVPGDLALAGAELGLTSRMGRENVLHRALAKVRDQFDLAVIDCPPALGLLTIGALNAADAVLVPTQPQAADLRGMNLFLETLQSVQMELNPRLKILGVLITMYDNRLVHHRDALEVMRGAAVPVLDVVIGRSVRVAEAAATGEAITDYAPTNAQAQAYQKVANVVESWLKVSNAPV